MLEMTTSPWFAAIGFAFLALSVFGWVVLILMARQATKLWLDLTFRTDELEAKLEAGAELAEHQVVDVADQPSMPERRAMNLDMLADAAEVLQGPKRQPCRPCAAARQALRLPSLKH